MTPAAPGSTPLDRRGPHRGDRRRSALLASLDDLLQDSTLDSLNIADISRRAGVTRSAFYFYFENKAAAVAALMGEMYDEAFAVTRLLVGQEGTPHWRVETVIRGLFDALDRNQHIYRAMLEALATNENVRALWDADRQSFVEPVARMITEERAAGRAADGPDASVLATVLLQLNDGAMQREALRGEHDQPSREQHAEALVAIWLRSIYGHIPSTLEDA